MAEFFYIISHLDLVKEEWCGPVKLGISSNPESRLTALQSGNPYRIGVYWQWPVPARRMAVDIERLAHERFEGVRLAGEWFDIHPDEAFSWAKNFNRHCLMILAHDMLEEGKDLPQEALEIVNETLAETENG